jgi:hypothetical protein
VLSCIPHPVRNAAYPCVPRIIRENSDFRKDFPPTPKAIKEVI